MKPVLFVIQKITEGVASEPDIFESQLDAESHLQEYVEAISQLWEVDSDEIFSENTVAEDCYRKGEFEGSLWDGDVMEIKFWGVALS
tara:strand:- start:48 stop:308 length:261 start_codon:yes stop_codon:yes gene_type:complete